MFQETVKMSIVYSFYFSSSYQCHDLLIKGRKSFVIHNIQKVHRYGIYKNSLVSFSLVFAASLREPSF